MEQELEAAADSLTTLLALRSRLERADREQAAAASVVQEARVRLAGETYDVARLEGPSWGAIVSSVLGRRLTDLERERAERDAATYAVAVAEERERSVADAVARLRVQVKELDGAEQRYVDALDATEEWLAERPGATRLAELAERRGAINAEDREIREAHRAGSEAHVRLRQAHTLLQRAEGWAGWDAFGGGAYAGFTKFERLDDAADVLRRADQALSSFSRELGDLHLAGVPAVNLPQLMKAIDIVVDDVVTDFRVRRQVSDARHQVAQTATDVHQLLADLVTRQNALMDEAGAISQERQRLLLG